MKYPRIEGSQKITSFVSPMKAQLSDLPAVDHKDWFFEIKWDGYQAIAEISKKDVKLYSRNGLTFDKALPESFEALKAIKQDCLHHKIYRDHRRWKRETPGFRRATYR